MSEKIFWCRAGSTLIPLKFCFIPNHDNLPFWFSFVFSEENLGKPHFIEKEYHVKNVFHPKSDKPIIGNFTPHYAATEAEVAAAALEIAQNYRWSHMSGGRFFCSFFLFFLTMVRKMGIKKSFVFRRWCDVAISGGGVWHYKTLSSTLNINNI